MKKKCKEKPIIFSTQMVKAILAGKKTQTRRVIKLREFKKTDTKGYDYCFRDKRALWNDFRIDKLILKKCPFQKDQTIWVRETFTYFQGATIYKADFTDEDLKVIGKPIWKPSIYMPRKAARIFLKVTNIRVERVQEISEEDAKKEGFPGGNDVENPCAKPAIKWFFYLWNLINNKRGFGWAVNPWVWVIEFERTYK
jgi:hypothetical protein